MYTIKYAVFHLLTSVREEVIQVHQLIFFVDAYAYAWISVVVSNTRDYEYAKCVRNLNVDNWGETKFCVEIQGSSLVIQSKNRGCFSPLRVRIFINNFNFTEVTIRKNHSTDFAFREYSMP